MLKRSKPTKQKQLCDQLRYGSDKVASGASPPRKRGPQEQLDVTLSFPQTIKIRLVEASVLADYEAWSLATSILASGVVGFLVGYMQSQEDTAKLFLAMAVTLAILVMTTGGMAYLKRRQMKGRTREVRFRPLESREGDQGD